MAKRVVGTNVIDDNEWNRAEWISTMLAIDPQREYPPLIGPVFRNPEIGRGIFSTWIEAFGELDTFNVIGVNIYENHYWHDKAGYFVAITGNTENVLELLASQGTIAEASAIVVQSRVQRCADSGLLQQFKSDLKKQGKYFLVCGHQEGGGFGFDHELMIKKSHITIQDYEENLFRDRYGDPPLLP